MKTTRVYDLPTRLFHWIFAAIFAGAFFIAKTLDDDSAAYPYHMLLGMLLASTVLLRIVWGIIGTRYARFSGFALKPSEAVLYFKDLLTSKTRLYPGHNPASSWAALVMMGLALGLATTGYLMVSGGNKEFFEEIHELFSNAFIVIVIFHITGVIFHTVRHRDPIGLSMINGKKSGIDEGAGIGNTRVAVGLAFVVLVGLFGAQLYRNYDSATRRLNFFGSPLQLGESENEGHSGAGSLEGEEHAGRGGHDHDEDGDDD